MAINLETTLIDAALTNDYAAIISCVKTYPIEEVPFLSQSARAVVVESIAQGIVNSLAIGAAAPDVAITALRDFMSKFGDSTDVTAVEMALQNLANGIEMTNAGDYRAIDAITDNMSQYERDHLSQSIRTHIIDDLARDVVDGLQWGNATLANNATAALRDFMSKFGDSTDVTAIEVAVRDLVNVKAFNALDAIFDNMSDYAVAHLSQSTAGPALSLNNIKVLLSANDSFTGTSSAETVFSRDGDDTLSLGGGADRVYAGKGNDTVRGGIGNDILRGEEGADTLYGDAGNDSLYGGSQVDTLYGGDGNDLLYGEGDNDTLLGGAGDDTLNGGAYTDILYGGTGADKFVFANTETGLDIVRDFNATEGDKLDFSSILDAFDPVTQAIGDFVTATTVGKDIVVSVDADGKGAGAAITVAVLEGAQNISVNDLFAHGQIIT